MENIILAMNNNGIGVLYLKNNIFLYLSNLVHHQINYD